MTMNHLAKYMQRATATKNATKTAHAAVAAEWLE